MPFPCLLHCVCINTGCFVTILVPLLFGGDFYQKSIPTAVALSGESFCYYYYYSWGHKFSYCKTTKVIFNSPWLVDIADISTEEASLGAPFNRLVGERKEFALLWLFMWKLFNINYKLHIQSAAKCALICCCDSLLLLLLPLQVTKMLLYWTMEGEGGGTTYSRLDDRNSTVVREHREKKKAQSFVPYHRLWWIYLSHGCQWTSLTFALSFQSNNWTSFSREEFG